MWLKLQDKTRKDIGVCVFVLVIGQILLYNEDWQKSYPFKIW